VSKSLILVSLLSLSTLAACGGAEAKPAPAAAPTASPASDHDLCVAFMTHARTCTDQFIPAVVDARAAADKPAGIKDQVAKDRDGVIAQAKQEWATDGSDAGIAKTCSAPMPSSEARAAATSCTAKTECGEFVQCAMPVFAHHLASR
jgi:hypothetical protein